MNANTKFCPPIVGTLNDILIKAQNSLKRGDLIRSEEILRQVIDSMPEVATAWHLRALNTQKMGNFVLAAQYFNKAHKLSPLNPNYLRDLGAALLSIDRLEEARKALEKAKLLAPEDAAVRFHLANTQTRQQELLAAIDNYNFCIHQNPEAYDAYSNLSAAYRQAGKPFESQKASQQALKICPESPTALNNLGLALCDSNNHPDAIKSFRKALNNAPSDVEIMNNLAVALHAENHIQEAHAVLKQALTLRPDWPEALINLGNILREQSKFSDAIICYQRAVTFDHSRITALGNLALALLNLNKFEESERNYKKALIKDPGNSDLRMSLGICQLAQGKYEEGWSNYEARWTASRFTAQRRDSSAPTWQGEPLAGRRIFVYAEQGFGDTLQFCRFLPLLSEMGAEVLFECQHSLVTLCHSIDGVGKIITQNDRIPEADFSIPLMSLPHVLSIDLETIPSEVPYLRAKNNQISEFACRLHNTKRQVGLVWLGNPNRQDDRMRSCPGSALEPILSVDEIMFTSLQVGIDPSEIPFNMNDFGQYCRTFLDTAAAIEALDLVITVDTATAHLAGALAKPVWLMLGHHADWRYLAERHDSPWYPTMRIFRQAKPGDWIGLTQNVADGLRSWIKAE